MTTSTTSVVAAQSMFATLPSKIRSAFDEDPQKFLDFCSDPENKPEMEKLGLLPKTPPKATATGAEKTAPENQPKEAEKTAHEAPSATS